MMRSTMRLLSYVRDTIGLAVVVGASFFWLNRANELNRLLHRFDLFLEQTHTEAYLTDSRVKAYLAEVTNLLDFLEKTGAKNKQLHMLTEAEADRYLDTLIQIANHLENRLQDAKINKHPYAALFCIITLELLKRSYSLIRRTWTDPLIYQQQTNLSMKKKQLQAQRYHADCTAIRSWVIGEINQIKLKETDKELLAHHHLLYETDFFGNYVLPRLPTI